MNIYLTKRIFDALSNDELANLGQYRSNLLGRKRIDVHLQGMHKSEVVELRSALERLKSDGLRMINPLLLDIDRWANITDRGMSGSELARNLRQFSDLLTEYIRTSPGRRIYGQSDVSSDRLAYYVNSIEYEHERAPYRSGDGYQPASLKVETLFYHTGQICRSSIYMSARQVDGRSIAQALAERGYVIEDDALRESYMRQKVRFDEVYEKVGTQFLAIGHAQTSSYWNTGGVPMMYEDAPAKVVIDVPNEEHRSRQATGSVNSNFWYAKRPGAAIYLDSDQLPRNRAELQDGLRKDDLEKDPEIPIHPFVPIYHLGHHKTYGLSVTLLRDYTFNHSLADSLVLPDVIKSLVDTLVSQGRISFEDIIAGKGAGACILLGGPPGTGKTLTAEVFAESTERALLSVQAAQLGVKSDTIESELRKYLSLANRWNAVMLIDEADVYMSSRGRDVSQNAIVAAFLRILEQHTSTVFLTTNRLADVDDAIASRCLARIEYTKPGILEQTRIWAVLNKLNAVGLKNHEINAIVTKNSDLSGRDIKQVLKLATLWCDRQQRRVDPAAIEFARQFITLPESANMSTDRVALFSGVGDAGN